MFRRKALDSFHFFLIKCRIPSVEMIATVQFDSKENDMHYSINFSHVLELAVHCLASID